MTKKRDFFLLEVNVNNKFQVIVDGQCISIKGSNDL